MDLLCTGIAVAFFLLTWGLAILCDRLWDHTPEKNS